VSARLPSIRRVLAGFGAAALTAGLVALLSGPWLRVTELGWDGQSHTPVAELEEALTGALGTSALAVDTVALAARIHELPSVADATVAVSLTGRVTATVVEPEAAFVWETSRGRYLGALDGTLFVPLAADAAAPRGIPVVRDERVAGRVLGTGDVIDAALVGVALRLAGMDPEAMGSGARRLAVSVDDAHGFVLTSPEQEWRIAFGVYGLDPNESLAEADARLDRQVTAVRTLLATRAETDLAWVDVRNPGKVYFRAKG
jgi:hypothetical protein